MLHTVPEVLPHALCSTGLQVRSKPKNCDWDNRGLDCPWCAATDKPCCSVFLFHLFVTLRKCHSKEQLREDVFLCLRLKDSGSSSYQVCLSSPSLARRDICCAFTECFCRLTKCISLKYGTATESIHIHSSSQTTYCLLILHIFSILQAPSRAWRLNYLFQARFTPHRAKEKLSKQRYKTSTWCFQGSLPGNRLISGRQMERCLSVFKCHGVQLSSSMFYAHMRCLDLNPPPTHTHT